MVDSIGGNKEACGQEIRLFCQCPQNPAGLSITHRYASPGNSSYCRVGRALVRSVVHLSAVKWSLHLCTSSGLGKNSAPARLSKQLEKYRAFFLCEIGEAL